MFKKVKLFHDKENVIVGELSRVIDWRKCCLCQRVKNENLTIPGKRTNGIDGYSRLTENLKEFNSLGEVPLNVHVPSLDDGSGLETTLRGKNAVWHKTCYLEFSGSRLERANERIRKRRAETNSAPSPVKTRIAIPKNEENSCIFCGEPEKRLRPVRRVSTENCSQKILEKAKELRDTVVLSRTGGAVDLTFLGAVYHDKCRANYLSKEITKQDPSSMQGMSFIGYLNIIITVNLSAIHYSLIYFLRK